MLKAIKAALAALSPNYWRDLAAVALSEEGADADEVAADLAEAIDAAIDFASLLPAPWGALVEAFDGQLIEKIVAAAVEPVESPDERKELGNKMRARILQRRTKRRLAKGNKPHKVSSMTPGHTK